MAEGFSLGHASDPWETERKVSATGVRGLSGLSFRAEAAMAFCGE